MKKYFKKKYLRVTIAVILLVSLSATAAIINNKKTEKQANFVNTSIKEKIASVSAKLTEIPKYAPVISGYSLRVPIFMYHYVSNNPNPADQTRDFLSISPEKLEEEVRFLTENGYNTISLDTLVAALKKQITLPPKPVILSFDDGYEDFYTNAYPILLKYNARATVFVITDLANQGYYLKWPQIQEMSNSNLISIESHLVHHYHLPSLTSSVASFELSESKKTLQEKIGKPVNFVAYPYGSTDERIINLTKQAGYIGGIGTWPNIMQSEGTIYNMPRFRMNGFIDLEKFSSYL